MGKTGKGRVYMGKKSRMLTAPVLLLLLLCISFLAGCGKEEEGTGYYVVEAEEEELFALTKNDASTFLLGTRFYLGEPVQLAGRRGKNGETGERYMDVYLCRASGEEELLWEGLPEGYGFCRWYLDGEGNGYCLNGNEVIRFDKGGGERYRRAQKDVVYFPDACVSQKGSFLLLGRTEQGALHLMELDPDSGEASRTGAALETGMGMEEVYIGSGGKDFLVVDKNGIWEADAAEGRRECIMPFTAGSYVPGAVEDVRVMEDGTAQVLRGGTLETLRLVDASMGRTVLTLRVQDMEAYNLSMWLPEALVRFNKESSEYYVAVEEMRDGEDGLEFWDRTVMEIGMGKGPDMLLATMGSPLSLIEKGALEDLTPYMEASGIREDDYFPVTFDSWRGERTQEGSPGIYGANIVMDMFPGLWADGSLFPGGAAPDLGGLASAFESYEGEAVFSRTTWGYCAMLMTLLEASDSIGGMVDWENGTCDFTGGLLGRLLELEERYKYRKGEDTGDVPALTGPLAYTLYPYANIYGNGEEMAARGMVPLDYLFDDANCAGIYSSDSLIAVNSASPCKEGAWEFISFLLGEEEQLRIVRGAWGSVRRNYFFYPVNRNAFEEAAAGEIAGGDDGVIGKMSGSWVDIGSMTYPEERARYLLTEEKVAVVREMLENARALPLRTEPILSIIREEAGAYFSGDRSVEDVCALIQNRAQLYLDEHR